MLTGLIVAAIGAPLEAKIFAAQKATAISEDLYSKMDQKRKWLIEQSPEAYYIAEAAIKRLCAAARSAGQTFTPSPVCTATLVAILLAIANPVAAGVATSVLMTRKDLENALEVALLALSKSLFPQSTEDETIASDRRDRLNDYIIRNSFTLERPTTLERNHYYRFFKLVVDYFSVNTPGNSSIRHPGTIKKYLELLVSLPVPFWFHLFGKPFLSMEDAERSFLSVLGIWLGLSPLFSRSSIIGERKPILLMRQDEDEGEFSLESSLDISLEKLLNRSRCIPREPILEIPARRNDVDVLLDLLESTHIDRNSLNILTLQNYADVEILRVNNVSRHLILSQRTGRDLLEVFAFPRILKARSPLKGHSFRRYQVRF